MLTERDIGHVEHQMSEGRGKERVTERERVMGWSKERSETREHTVTLRKSDSDSVY